jgi:hypothetical protein
MQDLVAEYQQYQEAAADGTLSSCPRTLAHLLADEEEYEEEVRTLLLTHRSPD